MKVFILKEEYGFQECKKELPDNNKKWLKDDLIEIINRGPKTRYISKTKSL